MKTNKQLLAALLETYPAPWSCGYTKLGDGFTVDARGKRITEYAADDAAHHQGIAAAVNIAAAPDIALLDAAENALRVLRVAVESGLRGFTPEETREMVENHSTIKALRVAIHQYKERRPSTPKG